MIGRAARLTRKGVRISAPHREVVEQAVESVVKLRLVPSGPVVPADPRPSSLDRRPELWDAGGAVPPPNAAA
jgi:hypothetical protein